MGYLVALPQVPWRGSVKAALEALVLAPEEALAVREKRCTAPQPFWTDFSGAKGPEELGVDDCELLQSYIYCAT